MNFITFQRATELVGLLFLFSLLPVFLIGMKADAAKRKALWIKYFVYLFLVAGVLLAITSEWSRLLFPVILLVGLGEMIYAVVKANERIPFLLLVTSFVLYGIIAFAFLFLIRESRHILIILYTCIVVFDGISQISGQLFGKRKIAPNISPAKTWEGFCGGMLILVPTLVYLEPGSSLLQALVAAVLIAFVALAGDLLASKFKRICGIKDFSRLIPGHGGVLDRFDSFIAVGAMWTFLQFSAFLFYQLQH